MAKLDRPSRLVASAFFLMAAIAPVIAWGVYLFAVNPESWRTSLQYALSSENEYRHLFVLMGIAGLFSMAALLAVIFARGRTILRAVLVGGILQTIAYAVVGAWFLTFLAAMPLWWVYRVQHDV